MSGDDLDFTGSGDHPVDAGLREGIKLLVLPGGVISKEAVKIDFLARDMHKTCLLHFLPPPWIQEEDKDYIRTACLIMNVSSANPTCT